MNKKTIVFSFFLVLFYQVVFAQQTILTDSNLPIMVITTDIDPRGTERHVNILNSEGERISIFINPSSDEPVLDLVFFQRIIFHSDYSVINISNTWMIERAIFLSLHLKIDDLAIFNDNCPPLIEGLINN